jgi:hypothetical protein
MNHPNHPIPPLHVLSTNITCGTGFRRNFPGVVLGGKEGLEGGTDEGRSDKEGIKQGPVMTL